MAEFHTLRSSQIETDEEWEKWNQQAVDLAASQPSAPLPSLNHLTYQDFEDVYEPAEDTYLLLDALQYELTQIKANPFGSSGDTVICLEIGCGSGVPSVFFRTQWMLQVMGDNNNNDNGNPRLLSYVTDINPKALEVTRRTFIEAAASVTSDDYEMKMKISALEAAIRCDLATGLIPQLEHKVSILIFNPPYVPTPDSEVYHGTMNNDNDDDDDAECSRIAASWAGGMHGRRVIDRTIPQIVQLLQKPTTIATTTTTTTTQRPGGGGVAYLVTVDDNRPAELASQLARLGLCMRPLFRRRAKNEFLTVQKITWIDQTACAHSQNDDIPVM